MKKINIGIDPGSRYFGWAVVQLEHASGKEEVIDHGVIHPPESTHKTIGERLEYIRERLESIIELLKIEINENDKLTITIEDYFIHQGAGAKVIPWVQGMVLWLASGKHKLETKFIPPQSVKKIITGNGRAQKTEVKKVIITKFQISDNLTSDEYDAIAVAYSGLKKDKCNGGKKCS
jgi:crossover junction endodeoxyribonuclease RuvC